jgi:hypothetical protein
LVSEFYLAAQQNRSGNQNQPGTFPTVTTQKQRAAGFRHTLQALLRIPYVVGADWFQYYDEPAHGRGDGENFNVGLVDIHDRPYASLTAAATAPDLAALDRRRLLGERGKRGKEERRNEGPPERPDASFGVPPAPRDPLGQFSVTLALKHWDRERGFVKPVSDFPVADLYLCWNQQALYLGLYAQDITETAFYRNKTLPAIDRAEWIVSPRGMNRSIHARLGPGGPPVCDETTLRIVNLAGVYLNTRNIAALELPARLFGRERLQSGDSIELASTFFTHCRAERVEWQGKFVLGDKR